MGTPNIRSTAEIFARQSIKDDLLCLENWSVHQQLAHRIRRLSLESGFYVDSRHDKASFPKRTSSLVKKINSCMIGEPYSTKLHIVAAPKNPLGSRHESTINCPPCSTCSQNSSSRRRRRPRSVPSQLDEMARRSQPTTPQKQPEINRREKDMLPIADSSRSLKSSSVQSLRKVRGILGLKASPSSASTCTTPSSKRYSRSSSNWTDHDGVSTLATSVSDIDCTPTKPPMTRRRRDCTESIYRSPPLPIPQRRGSLGQDCDHGLLNPGRRWHSVTARVHPDSTFARRRHSISASSWSSDPTFPRPVLPLLGPREMRSPVSILNQDPLQPLTARETTASVPFPATPSHTNKASWLSEPSGSHYLSQKSPPTSLRTLAVKQPDPKTNTKYASATGKSSRIRDRQNTSQSGNSPPSARSHRFSFVEKIYEPPTPKSAPYDSTSHAEETKQTRDPEKNQRKLLVELWFASQAQADGLEISSDLASNWCDALYDSRRLNLDLDPFGITKFNTIQEALNFDITGAAWWNLPSPEFIVASELQSIIPNMFESFWITDPSLGENAIRVASEDLLRSTQFCSGEGIFADDYAGVQEGCQLSTSYDADGRLMYSLLITTPLILQETAKTRYFLTSYINVTKYFRKHVLHAILSHRAPGSKKEQDSASSQMIGRGKDAEAPWLNRSHSPSASSLLSLERPVSLIDWLEFALEEARDSQELERHLSGSSSLGSPRPKDASKAKDRPSAPKNTQSGASPSKSKSLPPPGEIVELSGFIKQLKALHRDYFILAPGRSSPFYEVYYVSPHLFQTGECVDGLLQQTLPETRRQLKNAWADLKPVSIEIKWGKHGVDKMLYCTPLYGPGFSCWICFLTDACIGDIWSR